MKLAKLSLAAITVASLSASAFAADSLASMFKDGTVNGTLSAYYFNRDRGNGGTPDSANILDFGLDLTYKTATFNGFSAGATVQSTHSPFANDDAAVMFNGDMNGGGEVFSEAYVQYTNSGVFFKAGRQYISTPIVAGSGSRMTKESFEGYLLGYTGLPNTTLVAGYVAQFQSRTDGNGNIGKFTKNFVVPGAGSVALDKGAYTLYAVNTSVPGLKLQAQWGDAVDVVNIYYVQADYASKTDSFSYNLGGQYSVSDYDSSISNDNGGYYGLKAGVAMNGISAAVAYSKVDSDIGAVSGLGNGSDNIFTAPAIAGGDYTADNKAWKIDLGYAINKNANVNAYYNTTDMQAANSDYDVYGAGAGYKFEGTLKGLGVVAQYEIKSFDDSSKDDDKRFRFKATYAF
ncbi:OprD family outer membrane porin [Sulfurospirillum sp. 1612]|uniref:OprD family outer membrane porin n=1 Tax=Sulfurospirillum sp. 1612 TaxID=3094835 RepID=UPI002F952167